MCYTCIACLTIDSVVRMDKKNSPQAYLEECKYKIKKIKMPRFINAELESEPESESESVTELMTKWGKYSKWGYQGGFRLFIFFFIKKSYTQKKHKKQTKDIHSTSIVNVTIKRVSDYIFYEEIIRTKKHKKQTNDFYSDIFIHLKSIKSNL